MTATMQTPNTMFWNPNVSSTNGTTQRTADFFGAAACGPVNFVNPAMGVPTYGYPQAYGAGVYAGIPQTPFVANPYVNNYVQPTFGQVGYVNPLAYQGIVNPWIQTPVNPMGVNPFYGSIPVNTVTTPVNPLVHTNVFGTPFGAPFGTTNPSLPLPILNPWAMIHPSIVGNPTTNWLNNPIAAGLNPFTALNPIAAWNNVVNPWANVSNPTLPVGLNTVAPFGLGTNPINPFVNYPVMNPWTIPNTLNTIQNYAWGIGTHGVTPYGTPVNPFVGGNVPTNFCSPFGTTFGAHTGIINTPIGNPFFGTTPNAVFGNAFNCNPFTCNPINTVNPINAFNTWNVPFAGWTPSNGLNGMNTLYPVNPVGGFNTGLCTC